MEGARHPLIWRLLSIRSLQREVPRPVLSCSEGLSFTPQLCVSLSFTEAGGGPHGRVQFCRWPPGPTPSAPLCACGLWSQRSCWERAPPARRPCLARRLLPGAPSTCVHASTLQPGAASGGAEDTGAAPGGG